MSHAFPAGIYTSRHRLTAAQLDMLHEAVVTRRVDRATARQLAAVLNAARELHDEHGIDGRGRCTICRTPGWRLWRRRLCTVYATFGANLGEPPEGGP